MKKVVYILTLAALMTLMACNSENGTSSKSVDADGKMIKTETSVSESVSQSETVSTPAADQPGDNQVKASQPKPGQAPFSAEDAVKYKEGIKLVKDYSDELNKCVEAKMSGNSIDEAQKQRITDIQNKLSELEKAGKMNKQLIELKKVSDDVYSKVLAK